MSTGQNNTNEYSCEQSRLSKNKDQEKSAEEMRHSISKNQCKQDIQFANKECGEAEKSSLKNKENLNQSAQEKNLSKDKELNKQCEIKKEETHENKEGLFSRFGHVFSNVFERAREIIFPDLGKRDEDSSKNETKIEGQRAGEKEKGLKQEKIPKQESTVCEAIKFDKNRPAYIITEDESKPIYSSQLHENQAQMQESEKQIPLSGGSLKEKSDDNRAQEQYKETELFNEQPKEELGTPIKQEEKQSITHGSLDQKTVMEKLENLNLNKKEQEVEEKEEPINNQNFYQDISHTLQFGDNPAQEEMNIDEKKIPSLKYQNLSKNYLNHI